jgi:hypothetical protein
MFALDFQFKIVLKFQPYFCGQHDDCMILGSRWALNEAYKNIESFYPGFKVC